MSKVEAAKSVYLKKYEDVTENELKALGCTTHPSKEYLIDRVLEILAEAYMITPA